MAGSCQSWNSLKVRIDVILTTKQKVFVATSEDLKGLVVEAAYG